MVGHHNSTSVQKQLEAPMPWIGMYVALASLACSLAMAADVFHGFQSKKLWFPSKYFSLNSTSLTLLAVAMKLPVDLTTHMWAATDRLAKLSSLSLISTAMANFMPSLGSMSDKEILINVTALGILIITVIVDVCVQIVEMRSFLPCRQLFHEEVVAMGLMLLLLLVLESSAIMILTTKRYLDAKYQEMHNVTLSQETSDMGAVTADKLRDLVKKSWLMAETSSPQFVIARSVTCAASGVVCLVNALILVEALIRTTVMHKSLGQTDSSYGYSTIWILLPQTIGVIVGTIAPAFRWCTAISFRCSRKVNRNCEEELKIELYWTQMPMECQGSLLASRIRHPKCRKLLHNATGLALKFFLRVQIFIVFSSKLVLVISSSITGALICSFKFIKHLKMQQPVDSFPRHADRESESGDYTVLHVKCHALRLEGEPELPDNTVKSICKEVDKVIKTGDRQKPKSLPQFLQKYSCNFKGVAEFDSDQVQSLHSQEPPNCWSLPVVTLTSIAIALPSIAKNRISQLVSAVSEGLFCVNLIQKCLYENGDLMNIRKAADIWVGIELFGKWQEMDLYEISRKSRNSKETLQALANEGERIVSEFKRDVKDWLMRNPLNWPAKVIAANSMYRISRTILLLCEGETEQTDEGLFDQLSTMIADILAACHTNLTRVITIKCHRNIIEEREKSVRQAAFLLGKTGEILEFLMRRELPGLDAEQSAYIEEWRTLMQLTNKPFRMQSLRPAAKQHLQNLAEIM